MKDHARADKAGPAINHRGKVGTSPAERALAEAAERRARVEQQGRSAAREINGPKGLEPTRYGDWEKGGIASDF